MFYCLLHQVVDIKVGGSRLPSAVELFPETRNYTPYFLYVSGC